jgi:hypothetical protein
LLVAEYPVWVIHDPAKPTAGPAMSVFTRLRPNFALQQNFVMCQQQNSRRSFRGIEQVIFA